MKYGGKITQCQRHLITQCQRHLFTICPQCFKKWMTINEFLADPEIVLSEYQVNFKTLGSGFFLFNHEACNKTLLFYVHDFNCLRSGPIFIENKAGKDGCPGYCLYNKQLGSCKNTCECCWVRDVIQVIKDWEKVS